MFKRVGVRGQAKVAEPAIAIEFHSMLGSKVHLRELASTGAGRFRCSGPFSNDCAQAATFYDMCALIKA
jgi:hypothetical protein